jgi:hypothetical protein
MVWPPEFEPVVSACAHHHAHTQKLLFLIDSCEFMLAEACLEFKFVL